MHEESIYAERVLRAGANGYIMKQEATELVLTALRRILAGQVYVGDRVAARMLGQYVRGAVGKRPPLASLSDRELEAFRMIGDGSSTREIAEALHLSIKTVESYQAHIKEKLALRTGRELQHYAIEWRVGEKAPRPLRYRVIPDAPLSNFPYSKRGPTRLSEGAHPK